MVEDLSAELLERARRDQTARMSMRPGHGMPEWETVVAPVDRDNTARLREIVTQYGWPGHRLVGAAAAHAAWLLVQHAPPDLQQECLPLIQDAVAQGDASPADLAYLTDRVLMHRGEPQIYGTQYYRVRDGVLELWKVRDPAGLDQRRAALGLLPEAENRARLLAAEGLGEHQDDETGRDADNTGTLAEVNRWFAERHFQIVPSATDYAPAVRSSPWGKHAPSRDHHAWVDLVRLDGSIASPGYSSGTTLGEAALRARRRWEEEQEHGRSPGPRRLP